ncbi:transporter substrate-binding domain-containing protein [Streptomyces aureus]
MSRPIRALVSVAVCLGATAALTGCVSTTLPASADGKGGLPPSVVDGKELKVGLSPDFPPMEYRDGKTNRLVGVDVDLARALGAELGLKVTFVEQRFDQLMNSVATSRVDLVMSGISDTVQRQETVDFVDYFDTVGRLYTLPSRAGDFRTAADVCGRKLAVSKTTDYYGQALAFNKKYCTGKGSRPCRYCRPTPAPRPASNWSRSARTSPSRAARTWPSSTAPNPAGSARCSTRCPRNRSPPWSRRTTNPWRRW